MKDLDNKCYYRKICEFYDENCNKELCYRFYYFEGHIKEEVKRKLKDSDIEELLK